MVINETLNYSAFIINIFGTPKNIMTIKSPSSMKGEGSWGIRSSRTLADNLELGGIYRTKCEYSMNSYTNCNSL